MRGVVIHAARDLRVDPVEAVPPGPGQVRVAIGAGGICGSDLHYYSHGGFGTVRVREPMVLGHEISGTVAEVGEGVSGLERGARVAVNPSRPCGHCRYCRSGMRQQCLDMRFMGSAMRFPHAQGGFRQSLTVEAEQAVRVASRVSLAEAAMAEPLAVCLHAASHAGTLLGKRVLVTGSGPIGALAILVARHAGALEVVATDVSDFPLSVAAKVGATRTINVAEETDALAAYAAGKGTFDAMFECSGNAAAITAGIGALRAGGILVQVGLGGEPALPINQIVAKEIQLRGTFRFDGEFALAVDLMGGGALDVTPLLTATIPFEKAREAFELALDRSSAVKVQMSFAD